jgi:hypothetical protein
MKSVIILLVVAGILAAGLTVGRKYGEPLASALENYLVVSSFLRNVKAGKIEKANKVLKTDPQLFCVIEGKVMSGGIDLTDGFMKATPLFRPTLDYYMGDRPEGNKVFFACVSDMDYFLLRKGKIVTANVY